jgi:nucleoside-diphosphate-sugar epimerase
MGPKSYDVPHQQESATLNIGTHIMNLLIIGGSGHVSGAIASAAVAAHHAVWTVTRGNRPLSSGVTSLIADRKAPGALAKIVADQNQTWDLVVDCIGYDEPDVRQDIEVFRACARHLVFISTDFVYDPIHRRFPQPETADHWASGHSGSLNYGRCKRLCELALIDGDTGAMGWTVFRPCHIYGPTSELGCLPLHGRDPKLIDRLRAGETLRLVGGGRFLQQPILASDLAQTVLSVVGNPKSKGRIFNLAGPDILESREYYRIVAETLGVELKVQEVSIADYLAEQPDQLPFICHRIYDLSQLRACGLSVPSTPIITGLRQHLAGLLAKRNE